MTRKPAVTTLAALYVMTMAPMPASGGDTLFASAPGASPSREIPHSFVRRVDGQDKRLRGPRRYQAGRNTQADGTVDSQDLIQTLQAGAYND